MKVSKLVKENITKKISGKCATNVASKGLAILLALAIVAIGLGISWIITCGIVKLITICFGWTFNWSIATGIWFVMFLFKSFFNTTSK